MERPRATGAWIPLLITSAGRAVYFLSVYVPSVYASSFYVPSVYVPSFYVPYFDGGSGTINAGAKSGYAGEGGQDQSHMETALIFQNQ